MKRLTPLKAHRVRCLKCQAGSYKAIRECEEKDCESWEFRFGHNPRRKGIGGRKGDSSSMGSKTAPVRKLITQVKGFGIQRIMTDGKYEVIVRRVKE